ncbi:MAG: V-type ATP synthase subunit D [Methanocalculus sp.]|uniref:V-type ATP synthase subunit D n=1 Tax=Methanocalculus sp. TaxID=2004547 RepID=UPI002718B6C7|nr:V-type ATP synthase subunit D [Methanocalculus sp.]MDO9540253.1 V-type ATP synthase subunit D [Methanocalculus sp.]
MSGRLPPGTRPTRIELQKVRKRLVVAEKGHELLREKLDAMVMEFFSLSQRRTDLRRTMEEAFSLAYPPLFAAEMAGSRREVESCAAVEQKIPDIPVIQKGIMGTGVPAFQIPDPLRAYDKPGYSLSAATGRLDYASALAEEAVRAAIRLAEVEGAILRLSSRIVSVRRRANALDSILIPQLKGIISYISDYLEEMEREDLFRRKRTKARGDERRW